MANRSIEVNPRMTISINLIRDREVRPAEPRNSKLAKPSDEIVNVITPIS